VTVASGNDRIASRYYTMRIILEKDTKYVPNTSELSFTNNDT